jgi:predicted permease
VTLAQANADVARLLPIVLGSFPPPPGYTLKMFEDARMGPNLQTLKQDVVGDVRDTLWVLMGGISLVLLIACANVANLLLVRAEGRQQELAIRVALGATRRRIAAELLFESLILALLGSTLGLALAYAALRVLVAMAPAGLPRVNEIGINGPVLVFTLAAAVVTSLLFGSIPVVRYVGAHLGTGLRQGGRSMSESRERHRSRGVLVIVQVALALVLLISSGLMIRTFHALTRADPGFAAPSQIQIFRVDIPDTEVRDPEQVVRIQEQILHKIKAVPGVASVGLSMSVPMDGNGWEDTVFAKDRTYSPGEIPLRRFRFVAPGFFKTLGTLFVAGRDFTWSDIYKKIPVAIISEKLAREYWGNPSRAIGKLIRANAKDDWREVVGVVGNIHDDGMDKEAPSSVYWPILAAHFTATDLDVRRYVMLAVAGAMALFLGVAGLYGVVAYSVSRRRREIGIRMALGAQHQELTGMFVRHALGLTGVGVACGLAAAPALTRLMSSLLFGVESVDPMTYAAVSLWLVATAALASYIAARRAAAVNPVESLRAE